MLMKILFFTLLQGYHIIVKKIKTIVYKSVLYSWLNHRFTVFLAHNIHLNNILKSRSYHPAGNRTSLLSPESGRVVIAQSLPSVWCETACGIWKTATGLT